MSISPSDLFLSPDLTEEEACRYLAARGLRDPAAADRRLQGLAADLATREAMAGLVGLLLEALDEAADPDLALEVFAHFAGTRVPRAAFVRYLADDPRALGVLVGVGGASPWLGELLMGAPERFHWLVREMDRSVPDAFDLGVDADELLDRAGSVRAAREALAAFHAREMLRIGSRDILGRDPVELVSEQLSDLADVIVERAFAMAGHAAAAASGLESLPGRVAVLALGRWGGREMDYGADLPLVCLIEPDDDTDRHARTVLQSVGQHLTAILGGHGGGGQMYRVRPGLGPRHEGGTSPSLRQWEHDLVGPLAREDRLALVKARHVAGEADLAGRALELVEPVVFGPPLPLDPALLVAEPEPAAPRLRCRDGADAIECFAATLHAASASRQPEARRRNTLATLMASGLVAGDAAGALAEAYRFLRAAEHRWQLVDEPEGSSEEPHLAAACGRLLGLGGGDALDAAVERHRRTVHDLCHAAVARRPTSL
jgi:glutamate-ammonia-ligase adenylyltransferase